MESERRRTRWPTHTPTSYADQLADNGLPLWVEWRPVDDAGLDVPLYPDGVADLLASVTG